MILKPETVAEMIAHAERDAPVEACGYLAGTGNRVTKHFPMINTDNSEEHFAFDPAEQFAVLKSVRQDGFEINGVYHSHPKSPARTSEEDVKLAFDSSLLYVIISLKDRPGTVKGFRIRQGTVEEEPLIIEEENT